MNKVVLTGNIVRDPEYRATQKENIPVCSFTVAVQRKKKDSSGTYPADYINCVAWRGTADFIHNYFFKGSPIGVVGELQTRSYQTKDGSTRHITEVIATEVEFNGRKMRDDVSEDEKKLDAAEIFGDELAEFKPLTDDDLPF